VSGYLRSLSAQALGLGVSVKSAARLPYAALPLMVEPLRGGEASSPLAAAQASSTATSAASFLPFSHRGYEARDELRLAHAKREPADQNSAAPSMTRPAAFEPAELVEPARVSTPPALVPPSTRFVLPPALAPASSAGSARNASAYRDSTGSDATEVHVSIGRIEVTAVYEASPPLRRTVPVKKSMPLNEYLAQRQRGRP
jgi:hypothetical protein